MTQEQITKIVELWQERLGLNHWRIEIQWDKSPASNYAGHVEDEDGPWPFAGTWRAKNYDDAKMRFAEEWESWSVELTNEIIVHELLHLASRNVEHVADLVSEQLHRDVESVVIESFRNDMESFIDKLARRLVIIGGVVDGT